MSNINIDIRVVGTSDQLFTRGSLKKKFKKLKQVLEKLRSLYVLHFVLPILIVLTRGSDMAVLYVNVAFLILALSTKKQCFSFLKKVLVFPKIYYNVKGLKMSKISRDCHIKTCRSLRSRVILKISSTVFYIQLCSIYWL